MKHFEWLIDQIADLSLIVIVNGGISLLVLVLGISAEDISTVIIYGFGGIILAIVLTAVLNVVKLTSWGYKQLQNMGNNVE